MVNSFLWRSGLLNIHIELEILSQQMGVPEAKRPRRNGHAQPKVGPSKLPPPTPRLFAPFRALGFVTNHVPFSMFVHTPKGALATPTVNIVTAVGRSWMMWDAERMTLLFVGPDAGAPITSLAQTGTEVYAAAGPRVIRYHRGKEVGALMSLRYGNLLNIVQNMSFRSPDRSTLSKILLFGDQLLALKEDGTGLLIWNIESKRWFASIPF